MIRSAQLTDMPELIRMARQFHGMTSYSEIVPFHKDSFVMAINNFIYAENSVVFVADNGGVHGMAAAMVYPQWWNHEHITGQEMFWWVDEDHRGSRSGVSLLKSLEDWAKSRGAKSFSMIHTPNLGPKGLADFYKRRGYKEWDHTFTKEI